MASHSPLSQNVNRSIWLGVVVGWLAQLGLSTLLPVVAAVADRSWALAVGAEDSWAEHTNNAAHFGWQVVQLVIFFSSVVAGAIGGYLSPQRAWLVPVALVFLSLLATFFAQLPSPQSPSILIVWSLAPCLGLVCGVAIIWGFRRDA
jgi:hypothetical protein